MEPLAGLPEEFDDVIQKLNFHEPQQQFGMLLYPALSLFSLYIVYYMFFVVKKPFLSCNPKMFKFLHSHCPLLRKNYWPTIWCIEARLQTVLRSLFQSKPRVTYIREILSLPDGGELALDWVFNDQSQLSLEVRPTVVILPGLTGSSAESYICHMIIANCKLGFRSIVLNYRGNGGAELKTCQTYCATKTDDLENVIEHVSERFPNAPILATGISLGGVILTNYLAKKGENTKLRAGMTVSSPWNMFESCKSLEQPINSVVFNAYLCANLKQLLIRHEHLFKDRCDLPYVYKSRTIRDFDERFTSKLFGYESTDDYYHDACIDRKVHDIKVPLLCLNAADDPFSPGQYIPTNEASGSSNVAIVVTSRGGHIAFFDGCLFPNESSFMHRLFSEFVQAIVKHGSTLDKHDDEH